MGYQGYNVVAETVSQVTQTNSVEVGSRRTINGDEYIYVYNVEASLPILPGQIGVLTAVSGYSVTASSTTMSDFAVGICRHVTIPSAGYGWLLTKGFSSFCAAASDSFTVGGAIGIGAGGCVSYKTISTGYLGPVVGKVMVSCASGSSANSAIGYFRF